MTRRLGLDVRWSLPVVAALVACGGSDLPSTTAIAPTMPRATEVSETAATPAGPGTTATQATDESCADVVDVVVAGGDGLFNFDVTVSSGDTGWDKYADRWEVRAPDGRVLGVRVLTHPHETEQPFTRSLGGVKVPEGVHEVTVAAHDSVLGFCGSAVTVPVP